jgi:hypothetical protein
MGLIADNYCIIVRAGYSLSRKRMQLKKLLISPLSSKSILSTVNPAEGLVVRISRKLCMKLDIRVMENAIDRASN